MARTDIPVQEIGIHGGAIDELTWTAADEANDHSFVNDGKTLLLCKNDSGSAWVIDVDSVADPYNRIQDLAMSVNATSVGIAGPFGKNIWNQSDGVVYVNITVETSAFFAAVKYNPAAS